MSAFYQAFTLLKDFTVNPKEKWAHALGYSPFYASIIPRDWVYREPMEPFDPDRIQETTENHAMWEKATGQVPTVNLAHEHWKGFDPDNEMNMADLIYILEHENLHNTPTLGAGVALDSTDLLQQWARDMGKEAWFGTGAEDWDGRKQPDEELDDEHRDWVAEREHEAMWRLQGELPSQRKERESRGRL